MPLISPLMPVPHSIVRRTYIENESRKKLNCADMPCTTSSFFPDAVHVHYRSTHVSSSNVENMIQVRLALPWLSCRNQSHSNLVCRTKRTPFNFVYSVIGGLRHARMWRDLWGLGAVLTRSPSWWHQWLLCVIVKFQLGFTIALTTKLQNTEASNKLTGAVSATASLTHRSSWTCWAARPLRCCESCQGSAPSVSALRRGRQCRPGRGHHQHRTHWPKYMTQAGSWADAGNRRGHVDELPVHSSPWNVSSRPGIVSANVM